MKVIKTNLSLTRQVFIFGAIFILNFSVIPNSLHAQGTKFWKLQYEIINTGNVIEIAGGGYASVGTVKIPANNTNGFYSAIFIVNFDWTYNYSWSKIYYMDNEDMYATHISQDINGDFLISGKYTSTPFIPLLLKVNSSGTITWNMRLIEMEGLKTISSPEVNSSTGSPYGDIFFLHGGHSAVLNHSPILSRIDNNGYIKSSAVFINDKQAAPVDFVLNYDGTDNSCVYVLSKQFSSGVANNKNPVIHRLKLSSIPQTVSSPGTVAFGTDEWGLKLESLSYLDIDPVAILHRPSAGDENPESLWILANIKSSYSISASTPAVFKLEFNGTSGTSVSAYFYDIANSSSHLQVNATDFSFIPNTDDIAITLYDVNNDQLVLAVIDDDLTSVSANLHNLNKGIYESVLENNAATNITSNGHEYDSYILTTSNSVGETRCNDPLIITDNSIEFGFEDKNDYELKVENYDNLPIENDDARWDLTQDCSYSKRDYVSTHEMNGSEIGLNTESFIRTIVNNKTIYVEGVTKENKIQLISSDGRSLGFFAYNNGKYNYNAQRLPQGVYMLMIYDSKSLRTQKLVLTE